MDVVCDDGIIIYPFPSKNISKYCTLHIKVQVVLSFTDVVVYLLKSSKRQYYLCRYILQKEGEATRNLILIIIYGNNKLFDFKLSNCSLLRKLTNWLFNSLHFTVIIVRIYNGVKSVFRFHIQHKNIIRI